MNDPIKRQCGCADATCGKTNDNDKQVAKGESPKFAPWVTGSIASSAGKIPQVSDRLTLRDVLGSWKARWGFGRMRYNISPGLYAIGKPDAHSPVLVSANYKMSFDLLRRELSGQNLWILVLDTKGINVWCAAGKGTFGTGELVDRIAQAKLQDVVMHRTLILPQLGASGVAAHEVRKLSGFKVVYGPVRASDISSFLATGLKATAEMRKVRFGLLDRLVLAPMELIGVIKPVLILLAFLLIKDFVAASSAPFTTIASRALVDFVPYVGAVLIGTVAVPMLLPYVPGRAFAWKGWLLGFLWVAAYTCLISSVHGWGQTLTYFMILPPIASFLAMNFTGSSTYTSHSGVEREVKIALPLIKISVGLGILLMIVRLFVNF
ncbi:MAG: mercury methylation corrinoid protein HgcA [Armatimonadota bacterium]